MEFTYAPGVWPETEPDAQPDVRAGLESLGFTLLGGCFVVTPSREETLRLADTYLPKDRQSMREWASRPGQVFGSPDGLAFVKVCWFYDRPYAEFLTVLPDGRLVQTEIAWGGDPAWAAGRQAAYARTTSWRREQVLFGSPAAFQRIVEGDASAVWTAHRVHVAEVSGQTEIPAHDRLDDAVALLQEAQRSRGAFKSRTQETSWGVLAVPSLLLLAIAAFFWGPDLTTTVTYGLLVTLSSIFVSGPIWLQTRHWRWLRPRFRAPVPHSGLPPVS